MCSDDLAKAWLLDVQIEIKSDNSLHKAWHHNDLLISAWSQHEL